MKLELRKTEDLSLEPVLKKARLALSQSRGELANSTAKLERLMSEHQMELQSARVKCARISNSFRRLVEQGTIRCLYGDARELAQLVVAGEDLESVVSNDRRQLESLYGAHHKKADDSDFEADLLVMKHWDWERAAVEVLKHAIVLQKQSEAALRRSAMVQFAQAIAEARGALARRFLVALKEAQQLISEDSRITEGLGLQPEEIEMLRPKAFPRNLPSSELIDWLFEMVSQKLIRAEDLSGLQLTAPARDLRS
jgi:hypothetical protein